MGYNVRNTILVSCVLGVCAFAPLLARRGPEHQTAAADEAAAARNTLVLETDTARGLDVLQDTIAASRRTAIVRAAERVAPAVVSVTVTVRENVQPRTLL